MADDRNPRCDCGACCDECGHDMGCSAFGPAPATDLEQRIAALRPGSFLAFLVGGSAGGAA